MSKQQKRNTLLPILLMAFGLLLIAGAFTWYLSVIPAGSGESTQSEMLVEDDYPQIPRLSVEEAKTAFDTGSAVFLDVRDADSYSRGHIQGALSIPLEELPARMDELDPSTWVITY